jgi:glutamate-1-semialdehyde 2,1-aminomutase
VGLFLAHPDQAGDQPTALPAPGDYTSARLWAGNGVYPAFFHAMLRRGVALAPGPYEVMFPGMAHDDDLLGRVVEIAGAAAADVARDQIPA